MTLSEDERLQQGVPSNESKLLQKIERLERENVRLAEEVKSLVRAEAKLYEYQSKLDRQRSQYREIANLSHVFTTSLSLEKLIEKIAYTIVYELNYERVYISLFEQSYRAYDGYYDDSSIQVIESVDHQELYKAVVSPLRDEQYILFSEGDQGSVASCLRRVLGMDELIVHSLGFADRALKGVLVAGNTRAQARFQQRVTPDSDANNILANLTVQTIAAIKNHEYYGALDKERGLLREKVRELSEREQQLSEVNLELEQALTDRQLLTLQFFQAQKMEAVGTLAGGIAHDFNNLLTGIIGNMSLVLQRMEPEHPDYELLADVESYALSAAAVTKQLLGYARGGKYEVRSLPLNETVHENLLLFGRSRKDLRIVTELDEKLWVIKAEPGQIGQALLNIFVNAGQAMQEGGELFVKTSNKHVLKGRQKPLSLKPGHYVELVVRDTGVGMSEETQQRIFEPFFTTKDRERGTGLGLASVYGIVRNHGGQVDVSSRPGEGATFRIYLPAEPVLEGDDQQQVSGTKEFGVSQAHEATILVVDDEEFILSIGKRLLERIGYQVIEAHGGREAIEIFGRRMQEIDLVILDMTMPQMSGTETFEELRKLDPQVKVLLTSGYSLGDNAQTLLNKGALGFLTKPFSLAQLASKVAETLS